MVTETVDGAMVGTGVYSFTPLNSSTTAGAENVWYEIDVSTAAYLYYLTLYQSNAGAAAKTAQVEWIIDGYTLTGGNPMLNATPYYLYLDPDSDLIKFTTTITLAATGVPIQCKSLRFRFRVVTVGGTDSLRGTVRVSIL